MTTANSLSKVEPVRSIPDTVPAPQRTLGWAIIEWIDEYLVHHETGEPFTLTREQARLICRWYEITPEGRFRYDRGALRRMRGTGKSPLAAVLAAVELCGPCRFSHFDGRGFPVAVPVASPWVQIAAVSLEQTRAVMDIVANIFSAQAIEEYGLDIGREQIFRTSGNRGRLHCVSSNPRSLRGARPTYMIGDETSEWTKSTGGHAMMVRIEGNLAKGRGGTSRMMELSNAYVPGEDSVAERTHNAWKKQSESRKRVSIMYDSIEAPPETKLDDPDSLRAGLIAAAGDAVWLDIDRIMSTILDPSVAPSMSRREFLNQITAEEDSLINQQVYGQLMGAPPLAPGDKVTLGFDGALTGDGTALIACRLEDRSFHVVAYWEPDPLEEDWRLDESIVDETIRLAIEKYNVVAMGCDIHPFESWVAAWEREFGPQMKVPATTQGPLSLDNRVNSKLLVFGLEALLGDMNNGKILVSDSLTLRQHWQNAKFRETRLGASFSKETKNSKRRVDCVAAMLIADIMARKYLELPPEPEINRRVVAWRW